MKRTGFNVGWVFSRDGGPFGPVVVPHDAMLGNPRTPDAPAASNTGYYTGARYRYRKHFALSASQAASVTKIEFEGIYRDAHICVNGIDVPAPPYGFVPFFIDVSGIVHAGDNLIEIGCGNAEQPDCRWYSGAGIYRPVWLWEGNACHIEPEGIRVTTLEIDPARIRVDVSCHGGIPHIAIIDAAGNVVARGTGARTTLDIPNALLWSAETPNLYRCSVELHAESDPASPLLDTAETTFGIRTLAWSPRGLFVNGVETLLRGGCIHCDNGVIGAASFHESEWRRIALLKEAGFNAVRIAHNPAPTALLDACDHLGMYVMDEAWDMWYTLKCRHDYARHFLDWCDFDLARLAGRDYNHPSVIMYSIGNEVADPLETQGVELEKSLVELVHSLDPTRPVTCGLNLAMMVMEHFGSSWYAQGEGVSEPATGNEPPRSSMLFNLTAQATGRGMTLLANMPGADALVSPALDALDIAGYNYASARYAIDARLHPDRIVVGSETFPHELADNWLNVRTIPNLIGDFMWAAWDYLGEAGAGSWAYTPEEAGFSKPWPWLIAGSGALDILGNPNAAAALARAVWQPENGPSIQVRPINRMQGRTYKATWRGTDAIPSWSWRGCEGIGAQVEVYDGLAHAIRLELNGRTIATRRIVKCVARFSLAYEPGELVAIALDAAGRERGRAHLLSATGALRIEARLENTARAGGIAYVRVAICGENQEVESNADATLTVAVDGGTLLGFGSAQPAPTERFLDGTYTTYRGHALAVVHRAEPGTATLEIRSDGFAPIALSIPFEQE